MQCSLLDSLCRFLEPQQSKNVTETSAHSIQDHSTLIYDALQRGGAHITEKNFWCHFDIGSPLPYSDIQSYFEAERQWKVLLNPRREVFYDVLYRSIRTLAANRICVHGKVISADTERVSSRKVLDDPCEPKIIFYIYGSSAEESKEKLVRFIEALDIEFSFEEVNEFGCPQGERYRADLGRSVPQDGPSFTKMLSSLIYYQQGGAEESGRMAIVEGELKRHAEGYQTLQDTQERIESKLNQFFHGENYFLHRDTSDPIWARRPVRPIICESKGIKELKYEPKDIHWISGSTSQSLPFIIHFPLSDVPALVPTGILLQHNRLVLCGALDQGMRLFEEGFNWWELSGCAPKNAKEVFAYTKCQDITLEKEKKIILSITSQSLDALVRAKIAALRISFFETQENREELAAHLQTVIDQLPHSPPMEMGWKKYLPLLGKVVPEKNYPPKSEFCPGSVVVGWNKWSQEIQFGVIQFKESENIQVYFKGVEIMQGATASFALLSQEQLEAYKNLFPLCTQASYEIINENFSSVYVSSIKPSVNDWFNFASLIGKQAPESLFKENSSFDPGTICGMVTGDGRYIYAVVIAVAPEKITAMTGENQVYSMDRPIYRELISIPMELLEAEFFKYPPMADTEPLEQKIEERMKTPRQQLEDIARILQKINPLKLTDQDQKFINKPFPIVWGSMKHPQSFWNRAAPELILSGCQFLGSDIQFLFTEPSHVKKVKKYLDAHMPRGLRVQVLPFSELPSR